MSYRPEQGRDKLFGLEKTVVEYIARVDDSFLAKYGIFKGDDNNITDHDIFREIDSEIRLLSVEYGGVCANTVCGYSNLGLIGVFAGCVGNDHTKSLCYDALVESRAIPYLMERNRENNKIYTLITPDGERTFLINLSKFFGITPEEIPVFSLVNSAFVHLSAYSFDLIQDSLEKCVEIAVNNHVRVSFDMASMRSVMLYSDEITKLLSKVDILFLNQEEAAAFGYPKGGEQKLIEDLISIYHVKLVALKQGENGCILGSEKERITVPAYKVGVVNTNGAGDGFAAGLLYGIAKGYDLETSGKIANYYASRIIMQHSTRLNYRIENIEKKI